MAGDARSRYEIVSELANKRIELISELGKLKSKKGEWEGEIEKKKLYSARRQKEILDALPNILKRNHEQARQKKRDLESYKKRIIEEAEQKRKETEAMLIAYAEAIKNHEDDKTAIEANKEYALKQKTIDGNSLEDDMVQIKINLSSNEQAINDVAEKVKSIDMALEAIKSISANNEKSKE